MAGVVFELLVHPPPEPVPTVVAGLLAVFVVVLVLPLVVRWVEENLELFFFVMGVVAFLIVYTHGMVVDPLRLWKDALLAPVTVAGLPIGITQVVLIAGLLFHVLYPKFYRGLLDMIRRLGLVVFVFVFISFLGLVSSIISVIVAAVILSEIIHALPLDREEKLDLAVYGCFAVGLGAALTPVGEPLSTIAISKLSGPPYHADFGFLLRLLGGLVIPGVVGIAAYTAWRVRIHAKSVKRFAVEARASKVEPPEKLRDVVLRALRVYVFVAALELLGNSFTPLTVWYFSKIPASLLYWVNTISAVVDNATLTAAEISPHLTIAQIEYALMGLLVSGGMLIPGNVPNIVAAGKLRIRSREWARRGVPFGLALLALYFLALVAKHGLH